jgi:hypothetical protein
MRRRQRIASLALALTLSGIVLGQTPTGWKEPSGEELSRTTAQAATASVSVAKTPAFVALSDDL